MVKCGNFVKEQFVEEYKEYFPKWKKDGLSRKSFVEAFKDNMRRFLLENLADDIKSLDKIK